MRFSGDDMLKSRNLGMFESWLNSIIGFIKSIYGLLKMRIILKDGDPRCYTNGQNISIGTGFPLLGMVSGNEKIFLVQGLILHELSHILYSPFEILRISRDYIAQGIFWPKNPPVTSKVSEYAKKGERQSRQVYSVYCEMINIFEDPRIENLALTNLRRFWKFVLGLKLLRQLMRASAPEFPQLAMEYEKAKAADDHETVMRCMFQVLLDIGRFGSVKGVRPSDYGHPILAALEGIEDNISDAVTCTDADTFCQNVNIIFATLFDEWIFPFLDSIPESEDGAEEGSDGKKSSAVEKALEGVSSSMPGKIEESSTDSETSEATEKAKEEAKENPSPSKGEEGEEGKEEESAEKKSANTYHERRETSTLWEGEEGEGGTKLTEKEFSEIEDFDPSVIERVASSQGKNIRDYDGELRAPNIDFGKIHENIPLVIQRPVMSLPESQLERQYNRYSDFIAAGKKSAEVLRRLLTPDNQRKWKRNQFFGTKMTSSSLANPNLRHFQKKMVHEKPSTLSIAILVDESGSMYGDKIAFARGTAIALYEMCTAVGINLAVFGHRTGGHTCYLHNYCMFGEHEPDTKYRLLAIEDGGSNRDGMALRQVAELTSQQNTNRKLVFVISDGQPAAYGYGGTAAEADIKQVVADYRRKHVGIIAAAIDEDKERIKGIYGEERFLKIDDLNTLSTELLNVVKRVLFM